MFIRPPLVWEVRASPPRTNCPVTLVLPEEEPRAVSPLAKKRSPKRRIDFKNDEQKQPTDPSLTENGCEDGTTSWADMVKNGYQRSNNSTSRHNIVKGKENDDNALSKQKKHHENSSKDTSDSSSVQSSSSNNKEINTPVKLNKETDQCCTEVRGLDVTRESSAIAEVKNFYNKISPCCDNKALSSEFSGTVVDTTNIKEDEGWEVVSRSRGKPSRKVFSKVQSVASTGYTFPISNDVSNYTSEVDKGSCKQSHDKNGHNNLGSHGDVDPDHNDVEVDHHVNHRVNHHHSDIDPDYHYSDIDPHHHHSDIDPDYHYNDIDPDHHYSDIDPDNVDFDHHSDNDLVDTKNYSADDKWECQDTIVVKDNDLIGEDSNENVLQETIDSDVDTDRAVSPYLQVSVTDQKIF